MTGRVASVALGITLLAIGPASLDAAPSARMPGFCAVGETELFGCMAGSKAVAVCTRGAAVQYRYGPPGRPELVYPATPGAGSLYAASAAFSGGGEAQIGFTRGITRYVVYSRVVRTTFDASGRNDPKFEAGVFVQAGGKLVSDRRCTRPADAAVDVTEAVRLLPPGEFRYPDE
jgi:hypothetical protein